MLGKSPDCSSRLAAIKRNTIVQTNSSRIDGKSMQTGGFDNGIMLIVARGLDAVLVQTTSVSLPQILEIFSSRVYSPGQMTSVGDGTFFVADISNNAVRKLNSIGDLVDTYTGDNTKMVTANNWPYGLAYYNSTLYVSEMMKQFISNIAVPAGTQSIILGVSDTFGYTDGGPKNALIHGPMGIVSDGLGNLYLCQADNHVISKIVISTMVISTVAGSGTTGYINGTGAAAKFANQQGIALYDSNNIIVTDTGNNRIRNVNLTTGAVTTIAGTGAQGVFDGPVAFAGFDNPYILCAAPNGAIYVVDGRTASPAGFTVSIRKIFKGDVTTIFTDADGLKSPEGIMYYGGYVYISDAAYGRITRFSA